MLRVKSIKLTAEQLVAGLAPAGFSPQQQKKSSESEPLQKFHPTCRLQHKTHNTIATTHRTRGINLNTVLTASTNQVVTMSRFFRSGDDSSTESSSDEEELYSEEEEEEKEQSDEEDESEEGEEDSESESSDSDDDKKKGASRFLEGWSESEESETEQTTKVRSAKDKRQDELEAIITLITNAQKINDWNTISNGKLGRKVVDDHSMRV